MSVNIYKSTRCRCLTTANVEPRSIIACRRWNIFAATNTHLGWTFAMNCCTLPQHRCGNIRRLGNSMQTDLSELKIYICILLDFISTKLRIFERKVLRRIYGPTKESDGTWRIKLNEEQTDW